MNLQHILQQSQFNGLSDADALVLGNQTVNLSPDSTPYTWSGIGEKLIANGVSAADLVSLATGIDSLPGGPVLDRCLQSGGFDFSNALNRQLIQSFEVNEPQWAVNVLNAMLTIGQPTGTNWQLWGVPQPTLADITAARVAAATQQQVTLFCNEYLNPLIGSGIATPEQIKSLVAGWTP